MADTKSATTLTPLTAEAERAREYFLLHYKTELENVAPSLNILVWGPGSFSSSPVRMKRIEIRNKLAELKHNPMFSEDLEGIGIELPVKLQEFAQAKAADMIVSLLEDAPGALAEAHDFTGLPEIAWKFLILIPIKYQDGYSAKGAIYILSNLFASSVYWYEDDEIGSCKVLTKVLERVKAMQYLRATSGY